MATVISTDAQESVAWPEAPEREMWWRNVLGLGTGVRECGTADLIEQQQDVPLDDDQYPNATHAAEADIPIAPAGENYIA